MRIITLLILLLNINYCFSQKNNLEYVTYPVVKQTKTRKLGDQLTFGGGSLIFIGHGYSYTKMYRNNPDIRPTFVNVGTVMMFTGLTIIVVDTYKNVRVKKKYKRTDCYYNK